MRSNVGHRFQDKKIQNNLFFINYIINNSSVKVHLGFGISKVWIPNRSLSREYAEEPRIIIINRKICSGCRENNRKRRGYDSTPSAIFGIS